MKFRSKSYLFIGIVTLILVTISTLAFLYAARSYALISARDQGQMAVSLVLTTLTEKMKKY